MNHRVIAIMCIFVIFGSGCRKTQSGLNESSDVGTTQMDVVSESSIDQKAARAFSDALVLALIDMNGKGLYIRMENAFQKISKEEEMIEMLDKICAYSGKPLEAEFKNYEDGFKLYPDGLRKPMRKYWYSVRTTSHEKGSYYLFVDVVAEDNLPACTGWSIVSFTSGVPEALK